MKAKKKMRGIKSGESLIDGIPFALNVCMVHSNFQVFFFFFYNRYGAFQLQVQLNRLDTKS